MKSLLPLLPLLLLTSCGLTASQWSTIGQNALIRELPTIYVEVQQTAAKNPKKVLP